MVWDYDPEDIPQIKHRDALRNELPPGAMRDEPASEAERRDMYAFGDPMLNYHLDQTGAQQDALRRHDFDTKKEMLDSYQRGHGAPPAPAAPGDHLINPLPNDLSSMGHDDEEHEEEGEPFYHVWHENGDYLGGSSDPYRARQIMGGHILNHLDDHNNECPGCGVMTPPADHGFSIQPVNGAEDRFENLDPKFSRVMGAVSRASDTVWR